MNRSPLILSLILSLTVYPSLASSNDLIDQLLEGVVDRVGDKVSDKVDEGLDKVFDGLTGNQKSPKSVTQDAGYCQVWEGGTLSVQEACQSEYSCKNDGTCVNLFVWPSGGTTHVFWRDGAPRQLNGKPTTYVAVGADNCLVDAPNDVFCFTRAPQQAKIVIAEEVVEPENVPALAYAPEKAPDANTIPSNLNSLFEQYATVTENANDTSPQTRAERCKLGFAIVSEHGAEIDAEMKNLILKQIASDKCLG